MNNYNQMWNELRSGFPQSLVTYWANWYSWYNIDDRGTIRLKWDQEILQDYPVKCNKHSVANAETRLQL